MRLHSILLGVALLLSSPAITSAQTRVDPGFNLFSASQDVEIGKASAVQVEQQLPVLSTTEANRLVASIGARLASKAPGARYPYRFKVVNVADLNAFALPGGPVYVNRGLIERVRTEGQLAGVIAHEIAHISLRHATSNASKAYASQAGASLILGTLFGHSSGGTKSVVNAVGGFGLNTLFLRYSRGAERNADVLGAQIMAKAGYDPNEMADFFEVMRQEQGRNPGAVARFFSDHPSPADRITRVRAEARALNVTRTSRVGGLAAAQTELRSLPKAPAMSQLVAANR